RPLFAVGHRLDATAVDTVAHEVLLGGRRAPVAEGEVVLVRAALVAVPGDADPEVRVRLEDGHLLIEDRDVFRPDVRLVEVEMGHRTEQRLHGLGGPAHGGERVRRALPGNAIRLFALARELLLAPPPHAATAAAARPPSTSNSNRFIVTPSPDSRGGSGGLR